MNKKIAVFTATRAEYGLFYWLLKDIQFDPDLSLQLLVSGTHLSPEFGETYRQIENDGFVIDEKIEILLSSNSAIGTAKSMGLGVLGFTDALSRLSPDILVVLGDRFEALAVAQTAMILRIPVVHLHGGEITEGAYDDALRHAITKLSYLHGASTEDHRRRIIQLGESPDRVFNVGAIGLDHLNRSRLMPVDELASDLNFPIRQPYVVVTYHPVTLADEDPVITCSALLDALDQFPNIQVILTYPNADDGGRSIIPMIEAYKARQPGRVLVVHSLGQIRYLSAVKYAAAVVGNSSSGIIEVPSLDVPTVNVGMRQKGRMAAKSVLHCKASTADICDALNIALRRSYKKENEKIKNPYGDGHTSELIIAMLKQTQFSKIKSFYDIEVNN